MRYTKLLALLLVVLLIGSVSLVACGGGTTDNPKPVDPVDNGDVIDDNGNNGEEDDVLIVPGMETNVKLSVGDKMPDLEFPLHPCSLGIETSISEYMEEEGLEALVIDFWAIWCEPCKEELPFLEDDYRHYKDKGLGVLAVTIDECAQEEEIDETLNVDPKIMKSFKKLEYPLSESYITYDIPVDGNREMAKSLGVTSIPRTFLITKDMVIHYQHTGFDESKVHALTEKIKEVLGE
ncbi:MAG: TlpA family protein disulfide reductase [Caldisericia bacterium]|nr:TlpA family protein disulfide reductase [Caldisericia bacterium]